MKKINNCPVCKCEMWLPDELCEAALKSAKVRFYCAYGHGQHFSEDCIRVYWGKAPEPVTKNQNHVPLPWELPENSNVIQFQKKSHP